MGMGRSMGRGKRIREVGELLGISGLMVRYWLRKGELRSLEEEEVRRFKEWDGGRVKQVVRVEGGSSVKVGSLGKKAVSRIMDMGMYLEEAYGRDLFKKRVAVMYRTTEAEVERILESELYVGRRVRGDFIFAKSEGDEAILRMAKCLFLDMGTNASAKNKLLETITEMVKQRGSGKRVIFTEVGDDGDKSVKSYKVEEE